MRAAAEPYQFPDAEELIQAEELPPEEVEALNRPVVHGDDVLKDEHTLANLVGQLLVVGGQAVEDVLLWRLPPMSA